MLCFFFNLFKPLALQCLSSKKTKYVKAVICSTLHVPHEHWDKGCSPLLSAGKETNMSHFLSYFQFWFFEEHNNGHKHQNRIKKYYPVQHFLAFVFSYPAKMTEATLADFLTNV